jgi:transaldolase
MRSNPTASQSRQSLWLDNITRDLLDSGTLKRYIDDLVGDGPHVESDDSSTTQLKSAAPTMSAISQKSSRRVSLERGSSSSWALEDLTRAADLFPTDL